MNLVIDIGNTRVKTGIFVKGKLLKHSAYDTFSLFTIKTIFSENPGIENSVICSVKKCPGGLKRFLSSHSHFIELTPQTPVPVKNAYKTPLTLGMDRLAAICGAGYINKGNNILVINAGTCIVYDFMDNGGIYKGGSISPGLKMRYKALHTFTGSLPLIKFDGSFKKLTGSSTEECIKSGVQQGIIEEISGIIREYQQRYPKIKIIVTGGDMPWLLKSLKTKIKGEPFLVLTGLNVILSLFLNQSNRSIS